MGEGFRKGATRRLQNCSLSDSETKMEGRTKERHSEHLTSTEHLTSLYATQRECLSYFRLLIRRVQRGQEQRAETSAAAEFEGVDGDEGTVDGTSLSDSTAIKSKSIQMQIQNEQEPVITAQQSVNWRKRVWKQAS